mgnify:FL=1|tara:strand:- start:930 stop:2225 length:1296 start_codon:yes stop_codon:yes gene_type:complete
MQISARLVSIKGPKYPFTENNIDSYHDPNTLFKDVNWPDANDWPTVKDLEKLSYENFNFLEILFCTNLPTEQLNAISKYVNNGLVTLFYFGVSEVNHRFKYEKIFKRLKSCNINTKNVVILEADKNNSKYFKNSFDFWLDLIHMKRVFGGKEGLENKYFEKSLNYFDTTKQKQKKFLCLNNVLRVHRLYIMYKLFDYWEDGFVSMVGLFQMISGKMSIKNLFDNLKSLLIHVGEYENDEKIYKFLLELPLELDTTVISNETAGSFHGDMPSFDITSNAYFSIANECSFGNMLFLGDSIYNGLTDKNDKEYFKNSTWPGEKVLKSICFIPTIAVGDPNMLKYIRSYGFKTFHPYIDESYDEVEDDEERLKMLVLEINRLLKMKPSELHEMWIQCIPIIKHNIEVLKNVDVQKIYVDVTTKICNTVTEFRSSL